MCRRLSVRSWLPVVTLLALQPLAIRADVPAGTRHARLFDYVGSYETDQLLADPRVAPLLQRVAGKQLEHLRENINVLG